MWIRALAVGLAAVVCASSATAEAKKDRVEYIYKIKKVSAASGVKAPLDQIKAGLEAGIERAATITHTLPKKSPDPKKQPKRFKRYLKRHKMKAYKVNLEVVQYRRTVETIDDRGHKQLGVRIAVRLFGETMPDRVMAFAGKGSATVKLEVGRKIRDRDEEVANHDAIEVAIDQAIAESLRKLATKRKKRKRRRRRK